MGELRVMGHMGDTRLMWDPRDKDETAAAKKMFDDLRKKNHNAYAVKKKGGPGEMVTEFDPEAGKLILAPPMSGGA